MKPYSYIILILALIACSGNVQNKYERLFSYAVSQYPRINNINWEINYHNSVEWDIEHINIEGIGKKNDTICNITFAIFPRCRDTFVNIIEYGELYSSNNYQYYTSYDSAFVPVYKYKYNEENPDSVVFLFGEDRFFDGGTY